MKRSFLIPLVSVLFLTACNEIGLNVKREVVPTINYPHAAYTLEQDVSVSLVPTQAGGRVSSCLITPALPSGLNLNQSTCAIEGTPTSIMGATIFSVTPVNALGEGESRNIELSVIYNAPQISYSSGSYTFSIGNSTSTTGIPSRTAGAIQNCIISPALPAGLNLNTSTCEISGTPSVPSATDTYTITPSNGAGSGTPRAILITVNNIVPIIQYSAGSYNFSFNDNSSTSGVPTNSGGAILSCGITPALSAGLSISQTTCEISGTPTALVGITTYSITPSNMVGSGATRSVSITINNIVPNIAYSGATYSFNMSSASTTGTPVNSGGGITGCSVSPNLPDGLSINTSSCVISGTPTSLSSAADYLVTPSNEMGSGAARTLSIEVKMAAPNLTYSPSTWDFVYNQFEQMTAPTNSGTAITGCRVFPALPTGLFINPTNCSIRGTATLVSPSRDYTVIAKGADGEGSPRTITLGVPYVGDDFALGNFYDGSEKYETGFGNPYNIRAVDLNNDNKLDLVLNLSSTAQTVVFINNGSGKFLSKTTYNALYTRVADLNNDGFLDLYGTSSTYLRNNGDTTFSVSNLISPEQNIAEIADLNGDGRMDLITSFWGVGIRLNNGDGTFTNVNYVTDYSAIEGIRAVDLNGDGRKDIVFSSSSWPDNGIRALINNGDGTFAATAEVVYTTSTTKFEVADLHQDGPEIIVQGPSGQRSYIRTGLNTYAFSDYTISHYSTDIKVVDINNDGLLDMIGLSSSSSGGYFSAILNNGDGTFAIPSNLSAYRWTNSISMADLNGDSIADLISVDQSNHLTVTLGTGLMTFPKIQETLSTGNTPASVYVTDLNGDGHPDVMTADRASNQINVRLNNGDGTFAVAVPNATGNQPYKVFAADLNGDGRPDLMSADNGANQIRVRLNNGNGTFASDSVYSTGAQPRGVFAADLNGDGRADLLSADYGANQVRVRFNTGSGLFSPSTSNYPTTAQPNCIFAIDLNADGFTDFMTGDTSGQVSIRFNNGDGTFGDIVPVTGVASPTSIYAVDVTNDGHPDILLTGSHSATNGRVTVLRNNGNGTFTNIGAHMTEDGPSGIYATDLNGDGWADLVVANSTAQVVSVYYNTKTTPFFSGYPVVHKVGISPLDVFAADINGDGIPDLISADSGSNQISIIPWRPYTP